MQWRGGEWDGNNGVSAWIKGNGISGLKAVCIRAESQRHLRSIFAPIGKQGGVETNNS